jgi:hypothetical protein
MAKLPAPLQPFFGTAEQDLVARYAHLSPTHLQGALKGISGFGKVKRETTEAVPEPRQDGQNSNPTVTGTGIEQHEQKGDDVQVVEIVGRGERI